MESEPLLDDGDLMIRAYRDEDIERLPALANNPRIARNMRDVFPQPYTPEDARAFVARATEPTDPRMDWAVTWQGELAGGAGWRRLDDICRRTAQLGYWLGEPFWGRGIATRVARALPDYIFRAVPEIIRVEAGVFSWNPASARVLEKAGFVREAHFRQAVTKGNELGDLFIYARLRQP